MARWLVGARGNKASAGLELRMQNKVYTTPWKGVTARGHVLHPVPPLLHSLHQCAINDVNIIISLVRVLVLNMLWYSG